MILDWTTITQYLDTNVIIVLVALYALGFILKNTPLVMDWMIIYILLVVGIIFTILLLGFNLQAFVQGIIVAALASYFHQLIKQATDKRREDQSQ